MANRNRNSGSGWRNNGGGEYGRGYDRNVLFNGSPWQGGMHPGRSGAPPLSSVQSNAQTIALANNLIANLLGQRSNVPSLLDMPPVRRDFGDYRRGFGDGRPPINRMGSQNRGGNFDVNRNQLPPPRRSGPVNQAGAPIANRNKFHKKKENIANKSTDRKETEPSAENAVEEQAKKEGEAGDKKAGLESEFDVVSTEFLNCHVCDKRMWNGRSYENHVSGRAHNLMIAKTKESYALTVDAMRHELKISEMKRHRRNSDKRDFYCAMCDLYVSDGPTHRTSIGHRRLKKYLHPSCNTCRKEMPTRIEFDEHRLTLPHLIVLQELVHKQKPKAKEELVVYTLEQEMVHVKPPPIKTIKKKVNKRKEDGVESKEGDGGTTADKEGEKAPVSEDTAASENAAAGGEDVAINVKIEDADGGSSAVSVPVVLDIEEGKDFTEVKEENIPEYATDVGVGKSFLADFVCKQCHLCSKLLDTEETAEVHLKTWKHYKNFVIFVRNKAGIIKKEISQKRNPDDEEDGNAKKPKTEDQVMTEGEDEGGVEENDAGLDTSTDADTEMLVGLIEEMKEGDSVSGDMLWQDEQGKEGGEKNQPASEEPQKKPEAVVVVAESTPSTHRELRARPKRN